PTWRKSRSSSAAKSDKPNFFICATRWVRKQKSKKRKASFLSASQLVFLTSLVAIIRGIFTFRLQPKPKNWVAAILDTFLLSAIAVGTIYYFKHKEELQFYLNRDLLREWFQNNLGTFVFGLACLVL